MSNDRIAIVCHSHPDLTKGGAELAAYALFTGLRDAGYDAIFVASCTEYDTLRATPREGEFFIPRDYELYDHFYHTASPETVTAVTDLLEAQGVGTAVFHHYLFLGLNTLSAVKARGIRTYLVFHEYLAICHHHGQMVTRPARHLCRRSSRTACQACFPETMGEAFDLRRHYFLETFAALDGFISPSQFLKDRHVAWGMDPDSIHVIENGIWGLDEKLELAAPRSEGGDTFTIGYFGQITPFKGVDVLLDAVERYDKLRETDADTPDLRIRVHGKLVGVDEDFVERFEKVEKESPTLFFMGAYANSDVIDLMRACDYVIVPSRWWENSPVVVQEAFAAGCPVIASGLGGLAEKVSHDETGLLFRPGDTRALLETLEQACNRETLARLRSNLPTVPTASEMTKRYLAVL